MAAFYDKQFRLGILGGGQLGRMFIQEAVNLDVRVAILDPNPEAPCSKIAHEFVCGDFSNFDTVVSFGRDMDVLTIEIEHVNTDALRVLQGMGVTVYPSPDILDIVKDKGLQKAFYRDHNIATADFILVENKAGIIPHLNDGPWMQKLRTGGYDGRGVQSVNGPEQMDQAFDAPSVLEKKIDFETEISVIAARNPQGDFSTFPVVGLEFNPEANLVEFLFSPAEISKDIEEKAQKLAQQVVEAFNFVGIVAIEMFVTRTGEVLVNEIAPRPHNSGHHTIEANVTSQYEQHLRSILGLPLGDTGIVKPAVMVNLLGAKGHEGLVKYEGMDTILSWKGVHPHIYGKTTTKSFRKMGHVTVTADTLEEAKSLARKVQDTINVIS